MNAILGMAQFEAWPRTDNVEKKLDALRQILQTFCGGMQATDDQSVVLIRLHNV